MNKLIKIAATAVIKQNLKKMLFHVRHYSRAKRKANSVKDSLSFFFKNHIRNDYTRVFLLRIQCACGKIQTGKTPNTDTFHALYNKCHCFTMR